MYTCINFDKLLLLRGFNLIVTHAHHLDFQQRVPPNERMCLEPRPLVLPQLLLPSTNPSLPHSAIESPWAFEDVSCFWRLCFGSWRGFHVTWLWISPPNLCKFDTKSNRLKGWWASTRCGHGSPPVHKNFRWSVLCNFLVMLIFNINSLLESSRVNVSSNVSAMSHSRHSYSECLGNVLKYTQIETLILQNPSSDWTLSDIKSLLV